MLSCVLLCLTPGAQAEFGSVVRYMYNYAPLPLVLVPPGLPASYLQSTGRGTLALAGVALIAVSVLSN
jgi:hypothetical protein